MQPAHNNNTHGFTLFETILYIALCSVLLTGMLASIYPLLQEAAAVNERIIARSEASFIIKKIDYTLTSTLIDSKGRIATPAPNTTADRLVLTYNNATTTVFFPEQSFTYCSAPLLCRQLMYQDGTKVALPLTNERVVIENFSVTHRAPTATTSRQLDVSFTIDGINIGPIHYYVPF
jgi:hypothetical protein